ncbi:MAG: hypothetical protein AAB403_01640, partial [Planctomycetota bacterium]
MTSKCWAGRSSLFVQSVGVLFTLVLTSGAFCQSPPAGELKLSMTPSLRTELPLKEIGFRIVYETFRETDGKENWELYMINADGS